MENNQNQVRDLFPTPGNLTTHGLEGRFFVESLEHNRSNGLLRCWWAKDRQGYTYDLAKAHRFTQAEADEVVDRAGPSERKWPCKDVFEGRCGRRMLAVRMDG